MLIILEGPDGVGKTTLANRLQDVIAQTSARSVVTLRKGPPTRHPLDEYLTPLLDYVPGHGMHMILDRWHLGEYVYPRLTGRDTQLDDPTWWYLNQFLRRCGALLVWCHADAERVAGVYAERGSSHPFERAELYDQTEKLFLDAADAACLPQVTYDWANPFRIDPTNIVRTAQQRELDVSHLAEFVTYVGRRKPEYLLLGDVRHGVDPRSAESALDHRPAFVPYPATSGHWLISALLRKPELAERVALANACDVDDVSELWIQLDCPQVAVLGKNAYARAALSGIPTFGAAPHPQFGRRFHHKQEYEYATTLLMALQNQEDYSKWRGSLPAATAVKSTARSSTL